MLYSETNKKFLIKFSLLGIVLILYGSWLNAGIFSAGISHGYGYEINGIALIAIGIFSIVFVYLVTQYNIKLFG